MGKLDGIYPVLEYIRNRKQRYILNSSPKYMEKPQVTNIRNRMDNILAEIAIIHEGLAKSDRYPPCCLTVNKNGEISCDILGPLPEKEFLEHCMKCRAKIKRFLTNFDLKKNQKMR